MIERLEVEGRSRDGGRRSLMTYMSRMNERWQLSFIGFSNVN